MVTKNSEHFTFNGVSLVQALLPLGVKFKVNNTRGRGTLAPDVQSYKGVASDGARLIVATLPLREIEVDYTLIAPDLIALRKAEEVINSTLIVSEEGPLVFEDQEGYYNAIFSGRDVGLDEYNVQQGTLIFTCHKPFRYGVYRDISQALVRNKATTVTVSSGYKTDPSITLTLGEAVTSLTLTVNGKTISCALNITNGTKVVVDTTKLELRVAGALKVLEVAGEFPVLNPGSNVITLNAGAQMDINYREIYV